MNPLVVDQVRKTYRTQRGSTGRDVVALAGVSMEVAAGSFLAVMGASGSGKSTLLHLMSGLTTPDPPTPDLSTTDLSTTDLSTADPSTTEHGVVEPQGRVWINGTDLSKMNDYQLTLFRRKQIGLVFQSFNLIPTLSAFENVALPLVLDGARIRGEVRYKIDQIFERLGLTDRAGHRPDSLSGGEQQRVAIGRALVNDPAVILADEPTGNLDSVNSRIVCELLRDLAQMHGKTIVMVTHEPTVAAYALEVAVLKDGKLVDRFPTQGVDSHSSLASRYQMCVR